MELLNFTKMHGLGNDFLVINALRQQPCLTQDIIIRLCDRHLGIGCDQLLLIEPSKQADFFCRIYNADGSEAEQCGNGLRCVARFLHEAGIHPHSELQIETLGGVIKVDIGSYDQIRTNMGAPVIHSALEEHVLKAQNKTLALTLVSLGNPHAIVRVSEQDLNQLKILAPELSTVASSVLGTSGANIGFMHIINPERVRLRTYERGAGETLACGSNACAAVAAGIVNGWLKPHVQVEFALGSLYIDWNGKGPLHVTGPASRIFSGQYCIY